MSQPKRFGTFAGVFTPSILTILGVIMYMRLGWVVGEAGLIAAIGIIILAHIISVTTGLSISSIATDKKIKTGGLYYMLSRSLGLPMGGAIGITLFVGTAFSIALYIIGFCENFLGIGLIRDFLGLELSINDIRIIGTIVIIILVIIALISTSIAIKIQYFILAAIGLSLISIFAGFFINTGYNPETPVLFSQEVSKPFVLIFAIFFPAVTGFTAGVAMSGDLKNPKRSIPIGTLGAIITGLIIYLLIAFGFAFFVNRDLLVSDYNFLLKIAWFSPLVIAGIWGATLSSALGGILGGPRILQAISKDKITPKIFSKGHGKNKEPRNALIFTFFIAEIGILIGDLDIIARLVTMFFIAAYGFINLAYALESWASTDFRPSIKVSKWVGIIGFITSFAVMFKLDTIAMIVAFVIISAIYFIIKRKELHLDFGDVWESVWTSIIRAILNKMDKKELDERNWRPNIILFSGGTQARPHLIQLGKYLVAQQGFISNFDLIENKSAKIIFPKHRQILSDEDSETHQGFFTRRQECNDIYQGIEIIASTYGFPGIEPNTILMGWAKQSKEPTRFVSMIKYLIDLDLNILMLNYDKKRGFGDCKLIDIWWRGGGNNGNLALSLIKFILLSNDWCDATIRLIIVNPVIDERKYLYRNAKRLLDYLRLEAEVKIININIKQKSIYEIIQAESYNSDLTIMGIPEIEKDKESKLIERINNLCKNVGTVVFIKSSSYFKEQNIGSRKRK